MTQPDLPASVPGDTKDWTWVIEQACPECGFDSRAFDRSATGAIVRELAAEWQAVLDGDNTRLRRRPEPHVWSPLEYAAHVSDVLGVYSARLDLMLTEDGPQYPDWDQDATAVEKRYDLADPVDISRELGERARRLATQFEGVGEGDWARTGSRSDGAAFTIETFARYFVHDPVHHLHDVGVSYRHDR